MMNNIEWKDDAVCYANGKQRFNYQGDTLIDNRKTSVGAYTELFGNIINIRDFQLNGPREGDYIEKSELDTEQKYNDAVEVFGLFGCVWGEEAYDKYDAFELGEILIWSRGLHQAVISHDMKKRKLTYNQLMVIGKLKRLMNERKDEENTIRNAIQNTINTELDKPIDNVKSPSHYQLIEGVESIEIIARSMTQEQWKGFCLGNMLKYRIRAGKKDALQQDIDKANFYGELYEMHKEKCYVD